MKIPNVTIQQLLEAGVHLGHKTLRWNPKMKKYIFGKRDSIHIIDLTQTLELTKVALEKVYNTIANNGKILFVSTKKQASEAIAEVAKETDQYFVNYRWLGGMLTNWGTISNSIKKLKKLEIDLAAENRGFTKKELLKMSVKKDKLQRSLGGIAEMTLDGKVLPDDAGTGLATYMLMLKTIVAAGYVLVNISEFVYDTEFMMDCGKTPNYGVDQMCWNDGKNVDAAALKVLFDKIKNNNLFTDKSLKLDYNNMAALGYSVGSHMVSRMINNFPFMTNTSGAKFPTIKLGIMIGGGSYWCYNYDGKGNMTSDIPPEFKPCLSQDRGCCPNDKTEDNYGKNGPLKNMPHPAVLLLQGEHPQLSKSRSLLQPNET